MKIVVSRSSPRPGRSRAGNPNSLMRSGIILMSGGRSLHGQEKTARIVHPRAVPSASVTASNIVAISVGSRSSTHQSAGIPVRLAGQ